MNISGTEPRKPGRGPWLRWGMALAGALASILAAAPGTWAEDDPEATVFHASAQFQT